MVLAAAVIFILFATDCTFIFVGKKTLNLIWHVMLTWPFTTLIILFSWNNFSFKKLIHFACFYRFFRAENKMKIRNKSKQYNIGIFFRTPFRMCLQRPFQMCHSDTFPNLSSDTFSKVSLSFISNVSFRHLFKCVIKFHSKCVIQTPFRMCY